MYPYEYTTSGYSWSKAYLFSNSIVCKNLMMANNFSCGAYISGIVIKRHSTGTIIINDRKRRKKEVKRENERAMVINRIRTYLILDSNYWTKPYIKLVFQSNLKYFNLISSISIQYNHRLPRLSCACDESLMTFKYLWKHHWIKLLKCISKRVLISVYLNPGARQINLYRPPTYYNSLWTIPCLYAIPCYSGC